MSEKTILIVDDDRDTRTIIKTILAAKGYATQEAASGKEALLYVESFSPGLILLDIMMPEMSGYDVIARLKMQPETQNIPVIMLSAKAESEDILTGYQEYAVEYYITKPFTPKELINGIELVLSGSDNH
jgi:two-component system, OmpR family, alkaline phosphatase synthesis response regulator PhoP